MSGEFAGPFYHSSANHSPDSIRWFSLWFASARTTIFRCQSMKDAVHDKRTLRVAAVQFESRPGDKDANLRKIEAFVERAARQNVRLIIFPECCITGYWFIRNLSAEALAQLSEPIFDGPDRKRLIELVKGFGLALGAGLAEADRKS